MNDLSSQHGDTESTGEDDDPCGTESDLSTDCTSYSDRWKSYFKFEDGYNETQYGIRSSNRDVSAETKYDSSGGTTYDLYISDSDINKFQNHQADVRNALDSSAGSGAPTSDETTPVDLTVGDAGTSTTLYSWDIEHGNVDVGGRVSGTLDDTNVPLLEYTSADWVDGGRAEVSCTSNFAGGAFAWSEVFAHVDVSGSRSAEVDIVFDGDWEANLFAALGSASFSIEGFVREVTSTGTNTIKTQEILERSQTTVSSNGSGLTDPQFYNPLWYNEGKLATDDSNVVPVSTIEPGKEYHIGIRVRADTETFTKGPGSGRVHVSDFSNETSHKKGNLNNTESGKKNFVELDHIQINWEQ
ncbi:hypothetical protein NGM10_01600 [Halorussus salilacus]|uniref:hypothetical protein n=1 Tax=Halorussus salilacus TaxID=2953750 RepID=UPI00209C7852|nr:hypothetical protein [Halorussus salilacus]USZ68447.1 hypothetical protein NGM10_01600 [Halorussus salilacus]